VTPDAAAPDATPDPATPSLTDKDATASGTDATATSAGTNGASDGSGGGADAGARATGSGRDGDGFDLKGIVRQFATPMLESLDTRLREQVEAHVDQLLTTKLDAALADRLQTIDRAIAHLSRSVDDLEQRVSALEHGDEGLDEPL
jgi:hypothetical protein